MFTMSMPADNASCQCQLSMPAVDVSCHVNLLKRARHKAALVTLKARWVDISMSYQHSISEGFGEYLQCTMLRVLRSADGSLSNCDFRKCGASMYRGHIVPCCAMLCCAMPCSPMLYHAMPCSAIPSLLFRMVQCIQEELIGVSMLAIVPRPKFPPLLPERQCHLRFHPRHQLCASIHGHRWRPGRPLTAQG